MPPLRVDQVTGWANTTDNVAEQYAFLYSDGTMTNLNSLISMKQAALYIEAGYTHETARRYDFSSMPSKLQHQPQPSDLH